jgi:hypothetical protein
VDELERSRCTALLRSFELLSVLADYAGLALRAIVPVGCWELDRWSQKLLQGSRIEVSKPAMP